MITKVGSPRWITNQYRFATGGVDVKGLAKMNEERFRDLKSAREGLVIDNATVKVTISQQARDMFEAMQENMQKATKKDY